MSKLSRRDFLKFSTRGLLGLSGLAALGGLLRFLSFEPDPPPPQRFEVGLSHDYPVGSRTVFAQIPAILIHDEKGFSALSLTCPHLGCTVEAQTDEFTCPCHGSRYSPDGKLLSGPAAQGLKTLQVEITATDQIILTKG